MDFANELSPNEQQLKLLEEKLRRYHIPIKQWGKGSAKTIQDLLGEIQKKEMRLIENSETLLRRVIIVGVDVFFSNNEGLYRLVEDRQVFPDGRVRRRLTLPNSLCEKVVDNETPGITLRRAMREELAQVTEKFGPDWPNDLHYVTQHQTKETIPSFSYPGLLSKYIRHSCRTYLPEIYYQPEGYIEKAPDVTNYFVWQPVG